MNIGVTGCDVLTEPIAFSFQSLTLGLQWCQFFTQPTSPLLGFLKLPLNLLGFSSGRSSILFGRGKGASVLFKLRQIVFELLTAFTEFLLQGVEFKQADA